MKSQVLDAIAIQYYTKMIGFRNLQKSMSSTKYFHLETINAECFTDFERVDGLNDSIFARK